MLFSRLPLTSMPIAACEPSFLPAPAEAPTVATKLTVSVTSYIFGSPLGSPIWHLTLACTPATKPACRPFLLVTDLPPSRPPCAPMAPSLASKPPLAFLSVVCAVPVFEVCVTLLLEVAVTWPSPRSTPCFFVVAVEEPSRFVTLWVSLFSAPLALISFDVLCSVPDLRPSASSISADFFVSTETLPVSETWLFFSSLLRAVESAVCTTFSVECSCVTPFMPTCCLSRSVSIVARPLSADVVVVVASWFTPFVAPSRPGELIAISCRWCGAGP